MSTPSQLNSREHYMPDVNMEVPYSGKYDNYISKTIRYFWLTMYISGGNMNKHHRPKK
jgi:hypothetical protein